MTLLIRNVQILGSERKLPDRFDVFVNGDKIAAIGRFPGKSADEIIEGQEMFLAPGFIDVDTESDHYLSVFSNPSQEDFIKQGVTSIIGGMCGASLAPLLYGSLEALEEWTRIAEVNVDWHTMDEFSKVLEKIPRGVNFATLVGHTTIRQAIIGRKPRDLTKNELKVFVEILNRALEEGGWGLSTGLGYAQSRDVPYAEISALATIVKKVDGVYATHLRSETIALKEAVDETLRLVREVGVKTLISHFMPTYGYEDAYKNVLDRIHNLPNADDVQYSVYPFSTRILKLYTFLPAWAQKENLDVMNMSLQDEWLRSKILKELPAVDPKHFVVAQAPGNEALVGYTLFDLKKMFSLKSFGEALMKLMLTTKLQAIIFYENVNFDLVREALKSRHSLVASNAASFKLNPRRKILKPERATSTFTKFLSMVQNDNLMSIDEAIKKITFEPARKFNLINRGLIKEGYFADLVVFKGDQVNFVVVNGRLAVKNGEFTGVLNGRFLRFKA